MTSNKHISLFLRTVVFYIFLLCLCSCKFVKNVQSDHSKSDNVVDIVVTDSSTIFEMLEFNDSVELRVKEPEREISELVSSNAGNRQETVDSEESAAQDNPNEMNKKSESHLTHVESGSKPASEQSSSSVVISWTLDGRKAVSLPEPKHESSLHGEVSVIIKVNKDGVVEFAEVDPSISSVNVKLKERARNAAKRTRFNVSSSSPS